MENQAPPPSKTGPSIFRSTFFSLQIIIGIALVLATLFTAWTPGESSSLQIQPGPRLVIQVTPSPSGAPVVKTLRDRPLIGIVAGHWGHDSGTVCDDGFTEGQLNLEVASLVQKSLSNQGFDVDLLKEFDSKLTGYQASALVSIHTDSCQYINDLATGFKVAAAYASPHLDQATQLTACLRSRYGQATGLPLHSASVTNDMTFYHAFSEIDPNTPAAIIEIGFLNLDRSFLTTHTDRVVEGIVKGILCFIHNEDITKTATPTAQTTLQPTNTPTLSKP